MFIRVKRVKNGYSQEYEYAYLIQGIWKKGKSNSKHIYHGILGPVYKLSNQLDYSFEDAFHTKFFDFIQTKTTKEIYTQLIVLELINCGFRHKNNVYYKDHIIVDLNRLIVHNQGKDVVLKTKNIGGYICSKTLEELYSFEQIRGRSEGLMLIKKLKQMGIKLEPNDFYELITKIMAN